MPPEYMTHPRNRNSETRSPNGWVRRITTTPGSTTTESFGSPDDFEIKSIGDTNNGAWRKRQRAGNPVMSPMTISKSSRKSTGSLSMVVTATWSGGSRVTTMTGDFASSGYEASLKQLVPSYENDLGGMRSSSIAKALAKVNGSDMLAGETLADYAKTISMLRRPFKGATDLVSRIVKARNRSLKKSASNLAQANANAWLEYSYGWKPLLLDAEKVIDFVHRKREFGRVVRVARAEEKRVYNPTLDFSLGSMANPKWNRSGTVTREQTCRACSGVMYSLNNCTTSDMLAKLLGTRACDLPSTAWELIPFSFVVDWFANVGTWIRASVPDPSVAILAMWTTSIYRDILTTKNATFTYSEYVEPGVYAGASAPMNDIQLTTEWVQRNVNPTVSAYPDLTVNLSAPRILSALSLATQQIAGSLRTVRH